MGADPPLRILNIDRKGDVGQAPQTGVFTDRINRKGRGQKDIGENSKKREYKKCGFQALLTKVFQGEKRRSHFGPMQTKGGKIPQRLNEQGASRQTAVSSPRELAANACLPSKGERETGGGERACRRN